MDDEPNYDISVTSDEHPCEGIAPVLHRAVEAALQYHNVAEATINVAIVKDDTIAQLNERHLNHPGPTDVLTFDLSETDLGSENPNHDERRSVSQTESTRMKAIGSPIDGEIVVSWETALREAANRNHSIEAELALYTVHGVLHLLGYDDQEEDDAGRMHVIEDELLSSLGFGRVYAANVQAHSPMRNDVSPAAS